MVQKVTLFLTHPILQCEHLERQQEGGSEGVERTTKHMRTLCALCALCALCVLCVVCSELEGERAREKEKWGGEEEAERERPDWISPRITLRCKSS